MYDPNDDQKPILSWEDHIVPILEDPDTQIRDKALVAVAWESHPRADELHRLTFGDVEDRGDHLAISVTHLNGQKRILPLYGSMPYLKRWVQAEHPVTESLAPDADPLNDAAQETPIWPWTHSNTRISYGMLTIIPKRVSTRANVPAEVTLHDIRRSRAKLLAAQSGLRAPQLQERFGWGLGTAKEFIETVEDDDFNEDIKPRAPIKCSNCGAWTPQQRPCIWCDSDR